MAVMQMGMFFIAKNSVNLATFAAARAGAASGGDRTQMRQAFAKAMAGLYVAKGLRFVGSNGLTDVSSSNYAQVLTTATGWSYALALLPYDSIRTLNPRRAAFQDFGVSNPAGGNGRIIPATGLLTDTTVGSQSQQTRADALLLKIEVRHCYELIFPLIDWFLWQTVQERATLFPGSVSVADLACYAKHPTADGSMVHGVPIVSQAVVRMTVPAIEGNFN